MCRVLKVHRSGFYAWLKKPFSKRARTDQRLSGLLKQAWLESGCVYGYRKLHADLRALGEKCCPNKVARLAKNAGIKAQIGYGRHVDVGRPIGTSTLNRGGGSTSQLYVQTDTAGNLITAYPW